MMLRRNTSADESIDGEFDAAVVFRVTSAPSHQS